MRKHTMIRVGLGLGLTALLTAGCSGDPAGETTPSAATEQDPAKALATAAASLDSNSFKIAMDINDGASKMTGVMDPAKKLGAFTIVDAGAGTGAAPEATTELRTVGDAAYLRIDLPGADSSAGLDAKWRRLPAGAAAGAITGASFDAAKAGRSLQQATDVQRVSDKEFKGTLDLKKSGEAFGLTPADLGKLSTTTMPFQATVDDAGRLVRYNFTTPAVTTAEAEKTVITYSDYGTPVDVQAPPAAEISTT